MKLGELIKKYREEHDMSMRAFARASHLSVTYISMIENDLNGRGKSPVPSVDTYRCLARAMGMDVEQLIRMVDDKIDLSGDHRNEKKNPIPQIGNGISEKDQLLVKWFRSLPEEKQQAILIAQDAPEELL